MYVTLLEWRPLSLVELLRQPILLSLYVPLAGLLYCFDLSGPYILESQVPKDDEIKKITYDLKEAL